MAYEIYRQKIETYSKREPDLRPPPPHFYAIIYAAEGRDKGMLRVDASGYSSDLSFSIYSPDPEGEEPQETVTIPREEFATAVGILVATNEAARAEPEPTRPDPTEATT